MANFNPCEKGAISVVVGHYGSGKTEISMALALKAASMGIKTALVDLDIVNPFFRSAEKTDFLAERGVSVVAPPYALTGVDLPVLSAEVDAVFDRDGEYRVFDVGGDDAGAAALGRFRPRFEGKNYAVYLVANVFRPYGSTAVQIEDMLSRIEARSRLKVTALINNSNLADETAAADVLKGLDTLKEVSAATGISVACSACLERLVPLLADSGVPILGVSRLLKPDWLD